MKYASLACETPEIHTSPRAAAARRIPPPPCIMVTFTPASRDMSNQAALERFRDYLLRLPANPLRDTVTIGR